jgi:TolB-like protein
LDSIKHDGDLKLGNQTLMPKTMPFVRVANRLINMLSTATVWTGSERYEMNEKFTMQHGIPDKILLTITFHDIK